MKLELKNYFKETYERRSLEYISTFNETFKMNLSKVVFPCFFWGNINLESSIVTVSLNPKLDSNKEEKQQEDGNFDSWLKKCERGFKVYDDEKEPLHRIWKNLAKALFSEQERKDNLIDLLQKNVVNVD